MRQNPRLIVHADLPVAVSKAPHGETPVSPAVQKLLLLVIAVHEGETVAIDQLASIAGVGRETASMAVNVLLEAGLLVDRSVDTDHPTTFPIAKTGPKRAYWVAWSELARLGRVDLMARRVNSTRRRKERATQ